MEIAAKEDSPNFMDAAKPEYAEASIQYFNEQLKQKGVHVENRGVWSDDGCLT